MRRASRAIPISLFLTAACGGGFEDRATKAVFEPGSNSFWSLPLPSDLRRDPDGTFDLERWPGQWRPNPLVEMWLEAADKRLVDGWGISSGVFIPMSGAIDPKSLPADPKASMSADSSVFLLDIDPASPERGRRFPLEVSFTTKGDLYTPDNLLAAIPVFGFVRRPKTLYALVVTDGVLDAAGAPIGRTRAFDDAIRGEGDQATRDSLTPLRDQLESEGSSIDRVQVAAVFRTFDQNALLLKLVQWAEKLPEPRLADPWQHKSSYQSYEVFTAGFEVPTIQNGARPYDDIGEGRIVFGDDGEPQIVGRQRIELVLTVPKKPQPAAGFPITMYLHGSGGNRFEAVERAAKVEVKGAEDGEFGMGPAEWLARRGVATLGFDFNIHGMRHSPSDTTGLVFYNLFGNIDATLDNFTVAVMETVILSRFVTLTTVDPSLAPGLDAGGAGAIRFDPERISGMGQSMGTTLGISWMTVDPRAKGFVASGAGGILVEVAVSAHEPVTLKPVLEGFMGLSESGGEIHTAHPMLHAFQNLWDYVDPIAKAPYVSLMPHEGYAPRHIMMTAGYRDGYFAPRSQAAMATALGASLVGAEIEPTLPETLRLAGHDTMPYPLKANMNGKTVGVVHFAAPEELGHYVVFNQDGARHQYTCFVASIGGETKIAEARGLDDPCE
jgi:hypothetical protein